jgi:predicted enzyme related to lactoylglutathione lyase
MANLQLKAKLVVCNVPTSNSAAARKFYDTLFGGADFARSLNDKIESYYRPISEDGLTLAIATRQEAREPVTCYFAVDDLATAVRELEAAGGKVVVKSTPLPISGSSVALKVFDDDNKAKGVHAAQVPSHWATMLDPDGNYIGLLQLQGTLQHNLKAEPAQRRLSAQQVADLDHWKQHGEPLLAKP